MLKENSLNIPFTTIKCKCGNDMSQEFNDIKDFTFNIQNNIRNFGVICSECNKFIPITSFLQKEDIIKIMNNFMGTICNL